MIDRQLESSSTGEEKSLNVSRIIASSLSILVSLQLLSLGVPDVTAFQVVNTIVNRPMFRVTNKNNRWRVNPLQDAIPATGPIPVMPSQLFQQLALSQLELLASSLTSSRRPGASKVKSMALYLPQENVKTGQLEFTPVILFPNPTTERVFIASDADSGMPPTLPKTLTKLPGFAHANTLLPGYPMVSAGDEPGIGAVEEVLCDIQYPRTKAAALSVPLFSGTQTVGVLLVSPSISSKNGGSVWTEADRNQVARAAKSLSLAISLDVERKALQVQNDHIREALSDSLHQVKNPVQALRTYAKILRRRIADIDMPLETELNGDNRRPVGATPHLLELAEHLLVQSDRLVDRLKPVDMIIDAMDGSRGPFLLKPVTSLAEANTHWKPPLLPFNMDDQIDVSSMRCENDTFVNNASPLILPEESRPSSGWKPSRERNNLPLPARLPTSQIRNLEMEMTFVGDVLDPVIDTFRAHAIDQDIHFVVQESTDLPGISVSVQEFQESITNILDNAFKYVSLPKPDSGLKSNPAPQVRVRIMPNADHLDIGVTILVEDNGPGILANERELIFQRGVRSHLTQNVKGTGLGLNIARSWIEKMGGSIRVVEKRKYPNSLDGAVFELVFLRKPDIR